MVMVMVMAMVMVMLKSGTESACCLEALAANGRLLFLVDVLTCFKDCCLPWPFSCNGGGGGGDSDGGGTKSAYCLESLTRGRMFLGGVQTLLKDCCFLRPFSCGGDGGGGGDGDGDGDRGTKSVCYVSGNADTRTGVFGWYPNASHGLLLAVTVVLRRWWW